MSPAARSGLAVALVTTAACSPIDDEVFAREGLLRHGAEPILLFEGSGTVDITVELRAPVTERVSARYRFVEVEAQTTCRSPDFVAPDGRLAFEAGSDQAVVSLLLGDDELPELDEALSLVIDDFQGGGLSGSDALPLVIVDDDRTGIVDARAELGLMPGSTDDQSSLLQAALDRAAELGRGVVEVEPGDYEVTSVTLPSGTGLAMDVTLGCGTATVSVLDADLMEVVSFADVPVIGGTEYCGGR